MCEQLGTNPYEGELPIDFEELCHQSQDALTLFEYCTDKWDTMNGSYLGKDLTNMGFLLNMLSIEKSNWNNIVDLLNVIISIRVTSINKKMNTKAKMSGAKNAKRY